MTDFEKLVLEMRKAQKDYFKTRDKQVLELSKKLERKVDNYLMYAEGEHQQNLFPWKEMKLQYREPLQVPAG